MLLLVIVVIALGWVVFAALWVRDQMRAQPASGLIPSPYESVRKSRYGAPRTEEAALVRRQQVLVGLVVAAVLTFFLTRMWSIFWGLHVVVDLLLVAFAAAWYLRSANGGHRLTVMGSVDRFGPVLEGDAVGARPGPIM